MSRILQRFQVFGYSQISPLSCLTQPYSFFYCFLSVFITGNTDSRVACDIKRIIVAHMT
uniref:Uncharacterized protein n=1 Tax=Arundo donax TaxID=35708 RepID=A0A0A9AWV7_ARUDO